MDSAKWSRAEHLSPMNFFMYLGCEILDGNDYHSVTSLTAWSGPLMGWTQQTSTVVESRTKVRVEIDACEST